MTALPGTVNRKLSAAELGDDPGDAELLRLAVEAGRVLITLDKDFGRLVFGDGAAHVGLLRLPNVPMARRMALVGLVLDGHSAELEAGGIVTVTTRHIRVTRNPLRPAKGEP